MTMRRWLSLRGIHISLTIPWSSPLEIRFINWHSIDFGHSHSFIVMGWAVDTAGFSALLVTAATADADEAGAADSHTAQASLKLLLRLLIPTGNNLRRSLLIEATLWHCYEAVIRTETKDTQVCLNSPSQTNTDLIWFVMSWVDLIRFDVTELIWVELSWLDLL